MVRGNRFNPLQLFSFWSYSKAAHALGCTLHCFFADFLRIPKPLHPESALGQACHHDFSQFMTLHYTKKSPRGKYYYESLDAHRNRFIGFFTGAVKGEHPFDSYRHRTVQVAWCSPQESQKLLERGIYTVERFHWEFVELRRQGVWLTEVPFRFSWFDGLTLRGKIDLICLEPSGSTLIDFKPHQPSDKILRHGHQMTVYQLAVQQCLGHRNPKAKPPVKGRRRPIVPPVTRLRYYSYRGNGWSEAPVRGTDDIRELRQLLRALSGFYQTVLLAKVPVHRHLERYRFFKHDDLLTGDITPPPAGEQCTFCPYVDECDRTVAGQRPTARADFMDRYPKIRELLAGDPRAEDKIRMVLSDLPYAEFLGQTRIDPKPSIQIDLSL